jgi:glycosyltransferase involved in cell wall biosynthesis
VIYPPVDTEFFTPSAAPREDFYLCVSALAPYKRIDLAVAACRQLGRRLVVIGDGPERRRLLASGGRRPADNVTFLGWQPNEVIRDHLRRCRALLFPGIEDFGIVPLEAAACGAPVIARAEGGATETVLPASPSQRGTGTFFAAPTVESLAAAIAGFESQPALFDSRLARRQAERFTIPRFECELIGLLRDVVGSARSASLQRTAA